MAKVELYVYDITGGMARNMSMMLIGEQIDAVYHTGVVVFGHEFFFGGGGTVESGISACVPGTMPIGRPQEVIDMGTTEIPDELFYLWLEEQGNATFQGNRYNLLKHNCNNFSDAVCEFLLSKNIPPHITGLPERVMATPLGQMLRPMIEQMMGQMAAQGQTVEAVHHPDAVPAIAVAHAADPPNSTSTTSGTPKTTTVTDTTNKTKPKLNDDLDLD